jgi:FMN reductase (NADPH)/FMN reductase [NAD(P)H]
VLLFLADYQKWIDYFQVSGVAELCRRQGIAMPRPQEADLLLACCDALIAAQTAVIAAQSLGLGSCYIGDIMENFEVHRDLFRLPQYVFPICLLCSGYPRGGEPKRVLTTRFPAEYVVFQDRYRALSEGELHRMFASDKAPPGGQAENAVEEGGPGVRMFRRKFNAEFSREMRRSVRKILERWMGPPEQGEPRG